MIKLKAIIYICLLIIVPLLFLETELLSKNLHTPSHIIPPFQKRFPPAGSASCVGLGLPANPNTCGCGAPAACPEKFPDNIPPYPSKPCIWYQGYNGELMSCAIFTGENINNISLCKVQCWPDPQNPDQFCYAQDCEPFPPKK